MIIFQQGAHKTASSYCTQLLRATAEANGFSQSAGIERMGATTEDSFVDSLIGRQDDLSDLPDFTVIKTHGSPGAARELLQTGKAVAFVTFRDPLDCIRSLMDHALRDDGEFKGELEYAASPYRAMDLHLRHFSYSILWMRFPNVYPVYYSQIKDRPVSVVETLLGATRLTGNAEEIVASIKNIRRMGIGHGGRGLALLDTEHGDTLRNRLAFIYQTGQWTNPALRDGGLMRSKADGTEVLLQKYFLEQANSD